MKCLYLQGKGISPLLAEIIHHSDRSKISRFGELPFTGKGFLMGGRNETSSKIGSLYVVDYSLL